MGKALINRGWSKMEDILDKELPNRSKRPKRKILLLLLAGLLGLGSVYYFVTLDNKPNSNTGIANDYRPNEDFAASNVLSESHNKNNRIKSTQLGKATSTSTPALVDSKTNISKDLSRNNNTFSTNNALLNFESNQSTNENNADNRNHNLVLIKDKINNTTKISKESAIDYPTINQQTTVDNLQNKIHTNITQLDTLNEDIIVDKSDLINLESKIITSEKSEQFVSETKVVKTEELNTNNNKEDQINQEKIIPIIENENQKNSWNLLGYAFSPIPINVDGGGLGLNYFLKEKILTPYFGIGIEFVKVADKTILNSIDEESKFEDVTGVSSGDISDFKLTSESKSTLTTLSPYITFGFRWAFHPKIFMDNEIAVLYDITKIDNNAIPFEQNVNNEYTNAGFTKDRLAIKSNHKIGYKVNNRIALTSGYQFGLTPEFNFIQSEASNVKVRLHRINLGLSYKI